MTRCPNIILIILDTLRLCDLGCYGSAEVSTPSIDALARRSMRFTNVFPESLATINVRRALFTGRRVYPSREWRPVKWDPIVSPGWQPLSNDEDTLAENLAAAGYHTGFATDTFPYFAPGFNFTRGFHQWEYVRGLQQDRWRSTFAVSPRRRREYGLTEEDFRRDPYSYTAQHLANTAHVKSEDDTTTARLFEWGINFLRDNRAAQPFYLVLDSFPPHEPWDAQKKYYRMYGDPGYQGRRVTHVYYGPASECGCTDEEIAFLRANYRGLVSMVDAWLGKFLVALDESGLSASTALFLISDHGTNFRDNPRDIVGKPDNSMYPGLMRVPLLARLLDESCAGQVCEERLYNLDLTATLYDLAGVRSEERQDGHSLLPQLEGRLMERKREYVTCRLGHSFCYIDDEIWVLTNIDGGPQDLFQLERDPDCHQTIAVAPDDKRFVRAWEGILKDADGVLPDYRQTRLTDNIGFALRRAG